MNGLMIENPFGQMIIDGEKKYDLRKLKVPEGNVGVPLYIITNERVLGEIMITECRYNQIKHSFFWKFAVLKKYKKTKKIIKQSSRTGDWVSDLVVG